MLNLKKQILNYKIKKIIKQYPYVLFIQFNNVTPKKWYLIKDQLYKLGIIKTLRVKNQVARKFLKNADYKKNLTDVYNSTANLKKSGSYLSLDLPHTKQKMLNIPKKIDKINNSIIKPSASPLSVKTNTKVCSEETNWVMNKSNNVDKQAQLVEKNIFINEIFQGPTLMLGCRLVEQLPGIYTILEQNSNLLFIGGLFENQVITHLDFKKIIQLDKSIFISLIQQCSSPMDSIFYIKSLMDLYCFTSVQKSLLQTLNTYKEVLKLSNLK